MCCYTGSDSADEDQEQCWKITSLLGCPSTMLTARPRMSSHFMTAVSLWGNVFVHLHVTVTRNFSLCKIGIIPLRQTLPKAWMRKQTNKPSFFNLCNHFMSCCHSSASWTEFVPTRLSSNSTRTIWPTAVDIFNPVFFRLVESCMASISTFSHQLWRVRNLFSSLSLASMTCSKICSLQPQKCL